jgi:hypothetical protein
MGARAVSRHHESMTLAWFRACATLLVLALLAAGCSNGSGVATIRSVPELPVSASAKASTSTFYIAGFHNVTLYDTVSGSLKGTIFHGIQFPVSLAFGPSGDLYVGNSAGGNHDQGTITEYAPDHTKVIRKIAAGIDDPFSLATDSVENVYSANQFDSTVTVYAPGSTKPVRTISDGVSIPIVVVLDRAGNLYVANTSDTGSVTEYAPEASSPSRTITSGIDFPYSLALDTKGNLYVANFTGKSVTEYAPGGVTPSRTFGAGHVAVAVAIDAKNDLYVAGYGKKGITEFDTANGKVIRTITEGINYPHAIGIAPGGQLVVANYGHGQQPGSVSIYGPTGTAMLQNITDGIFSPLTVAFAPVITIYP